MGGALTVLYGKSIKLNLWVLCWACSFECMYFVMCVLATLHPCSHWKGYSVSPYLQYSVIDKMARLHEDGEALSGVHTPSGSNPMTDSSGICTGFLLFSQIEPLMANLWDYNFANVSLYPLQEYVLCYWLAPEFHRRLVFVYIQLPVNFDYFGVPTKIVTTLWLRRSPFPLSTNRSFGTPLWLREAS